MAGVAAHAGTRLRETRQTPQWQKRTAAPDGGARSRGLEVARSVGQRREKQDGNCRGRRTPQKEKRPRGNFRSDGRTTRYTQNGSHGGARRRGGAGANEGAHGSGRGREAERACRRGPPTPGRTAGPPNPRG